MSEPRTFGRYRVTGTLGAGAMGEVLAAVDEVLGREVAVKTLKDRSSGLAARLADERFRLEARAVAQLTHPNVVQVYDLDPTADPPYLVMERVAGPSLKDRIAEGPLAEPDVRALGIQIANALAAAHARGVVHRDVKPANILAAGPGTWKLADFGVAHVPDSSLTMTGQFVGSPAYAAPEALVRGQLGPEGDVFGLGATLYQAAAGTWPRAEAEVRGLLAPVPPLATLATHLQPELAAVIDRAVAVDPTARPSAAELAQALAAAGVGASMAGVPAGHPMLTPPAGHPMLTPPAGVRAVTPPVGLATVSGVASGTYPAPPHAEVASGTYPGAPLLPPPSAPPPGAAAAPYPVSTVHVATVPPGAAIIPPGVATVPPGAATVPPGVATVALPPGADADAAAKRYRAKHVVAGVATVLVVVLIAATRCSPSAPSGAKFDPGPGPAGLGALGSQGSPTDDDRAQLPPREPGTIRALTPPAANSDPEAARDWQKVVDKLYRRDFDEARRKLAEFETKHGESAESRDLAEQLDERLESAPDEGPGPGPGRGRGRKKLKGN